MRTNENIDTTEVLSEVISVMDAFPPFPEQALSDGLMWAANSNVHPSLPRLQVGVLDH